MTRPRSVVFILRPHTTNIGNDLIALATDGLLSAAWPAPVDVVSFPSSGPGRGAKRAGLNARTAYEANLLADAVLAGGGNVFENGALAVDPTALAALTVPLGVLGVSAGRVRGRDGRLVPRTDSLPPDRIAAIGAQAEPMLVRDDATAAYLWDLGVEHARVAGCPALYLDRYMIDLPAPDADMAGTALVSLRHPKLMSVPPAHQAAVAADVRGMVDGLRSSFDRVALVCHDYQDLEFAAAFEGVEVLYTEDPRRLVGWLSGCALSVGYRLHGFLAAVALSVPALHVSYDERGESMVATLGLEAYDDLQADLERALAASLGQ